MMVTLVGALMWRQETNSPNNGVNGPFVIHFRKGWKMISLHPYVYFSQRLSSSYTVRETPSLKPSPVYEAYRMM